MMRDSEEVDAADVGVGDRLNRHVDDLHGGRYASSYGDYVRNVFTKSDGTGRSSSDLLSRVDRGLTSNQQLMETVSPQVILRMEKMDEEYGQDGAAYRYTPLEMMYNASGPTGLQGSQAVAESSYRGSGQFSVYKPKSSAEYQQAVNQSRSRTRMNYKVRATGDEAKAELLTNAGGAKTTEYERLKVGTTSDYGTKQPGYASNMLIDYSTLPETSRHISTNRDQFGDSYSSGLNRRCDSRIVGSDFVMLSLRKDPWYDKVDDLLAEVRNSPRKY